MSAMAFFPAALALLFRAVSALRFDVPVTGFAFYSLVTATVGFQFIAPMLARFYSSGVLVNRGPSFTSLRDPGLEPACSGARWREA